MDVFAEINSLPQYLYVFENREMVLGGHSCQPNRMPVSRLYQLWQEIVELYRKDNLSDEEKTRYAEKVHKMMRWSESGTMSRDELQGKIDSLSKEELREIEWQIDMYKQGRCYYQEYVHGRARH